MHYVFPQLCRSKRHRLSTTQQSRRRSQYDRKPVQHHCIDSVRWLRADASPFKYDDHKNKARLVHEWVHARMGSGLWLYRARTELRRPRCLPILLGYHRSTGKLSTTKSLLLLTPKSSILAPHMCFQYFTPGKKLLPELHCCIALRSSLPASPVSLPRASSQEWMA